MKNTAIFGLGITVITLVLNRKLQSPSNARHLAGVVMGVVIDTIAGVVMGVVIDTILKF